MIYVINNKKYSTICSIHNEVKNILNELLELIYSDENFKTLNSDVITKVENKVSNGLKYIDVALTMGQRMEDGLRKNSEMYEYLGLPFNLDFNSSDED